MKNKRTLWRAQGVLAIIALIGLAATACDSDGPQAHDCARDGFCVWSDWEPGLAPTCTETGTQTRTCAYCGERTAPSSVPALGHEWAAGGGWAAYIPPDCTTEGSERRLCQVPDCGHAELRPIPALGHKWSADGEGDGWVLTTPPIHLERVGTQERDCLRDDCEEHQSRNFPVANTNFHCCQRSCCLIQRACLHFLCFDPEGCVCPDR